ncbi:MAG: hypothetical protein WC547_10400, partial [Candidatus Omnitrophota bacterium]
ITLGDDAVEITQQDGTVANDNFAGDLAVQSMRIRDQNWNIWGFNASGEYESRYKEGWNAQMGGRSYGNDQIEGYWIGTMSGEAWETGNQEFTGSVEGTSLSFWNLDNFSGDLLGIYNDGGWQAYGAGTSSGTPLSFVSSVYDENSSIHGLFGSTQSLWSEGAAITFMGEYTPNRMNTCQLWGTDLISHNHDNDTDTTYDGGAYYGMIGGTYKDTMNGKAVGIYVDDNGNAGTFSGNFSGDMLADLEMFSATGSLQATLKATDVDIDITNLRDSLVERNLEGGGYAYVASEGTIEGGMSLENSTVFNLPDQSWGIWGAMLAGEYNGSSILPASWRLGMGGETYLMDSEGTESCWLGTLNTTQMQDGALSGNFKGLLIGQSDEEGNLRATIVTGDSAGTYVEVEPGYATWQTGTTGEWVEVTNALNPDQVGYDYQDLQRYVSLPISEVYSNTLTASSGTGGVTSASAAISLFSADSSFNIWTAIINGTYNNTDSTSWSTTLTSGSDTLTLNGSWGQNGQWLADVTGAVNGSIDPNLSGQAGGTYGDGTFTGAGTGTWGYQMPN